MTEPARTLRAFRSVSAAVREAAAETRLAYKFNANCYSFSAMDACMAAERALDLLEEALEDSFDPVGEVE
jgi:hypothetical protein